MTKILNDIYIKTKSYDLWWGIYGLTSLTGWEDITFFDSLEQNATRIGYTCICTKNYLGSGLKDLEEDPDEKEFVEEIREYLEANTIHYHYCFNSPSDDDFFQLSYNNLPLNELGVKPSYIEMWHPNDGIDKQVLEECIKEFCVKFLDAKINRIHFIEPINIDEAISSYKEHTRRITGNIEIEFTDNLIQDMMKKLSKSKDEVLRILNNSIDK